MHSSYRAPMRFSLFFSALSAFSAVNSSAAAPVKLPNGAVIDEINFERHVANLLGKMGCNAGACHGSFQGKGGFRLSLFGSSPQLDYDAITRNGMARRIDLSDPDRSLFLLKPTAQVPHEGGQRFAKGSWQYQVLREWIVQGANWSTGRN